MKYDIFITDFDWTLGKAPDIIEEETVNAIKEYQKKGGIFVVCSGRVYSSVRHILRKHDIVATVCSNQGAEITQMDGDKELLSGGIEKNLAVKIHNDFISEGVKTAVYVKSDLYYKHLTPYVLRHIEEKVVAGHLTEDFKEAFSGDKVSRIAGTTDGLDIDYLLKKYNEKYKGQLIVNSGSTRLIEAVNPNFSKGKAVEFLSKFYGVPFDRIIAVGDSNNDLELIRGEWHGVAVGDGASELKAVAKEITLPFPENPVLHLLKKYCL